MVLTCSFQLSLSSKVKPKGLENSTCRKEQEPSETEGMEHDWKQDWYAWLIAFSVVRGVKARFYIIWGRRLVDYHPFVCNIGLLLCILSFAGGPTGTAELHGWFHACRKSQDLLLFPVDEPWVFASLYECDSNSGSVLDGCGLVGAGYQALFGLLTASRFPGYSLDRYTELWLGTWGLKSVSLW